MKKKQYKHRITGDIAEQMHCNSLYAVKQGGTTVLPEKYLESSQDWELITPQKEEAYTILQYKTKYAIWYLCEDGRYSTIGGKTGTTTAEKLNYNPIIWQIRRNEDSSIWTVGDKYVSSQVPSLGIRTIEKFVIEDESIGIRAVEALSAEPITTLLKYLTIPVPVNPTWVVESFICTVDNATKFNRCGGTYASTWTQEQMLGKTVAHGIARTVADGSLQIYSVRATPNSPVIEIGSWITAECTHMGNTPMQVEGFTVNDRNNLLIKTRQFRTHGISIENCKKVDAPVEKKEFRVGDWVYYDRKRYKNGPYQISQMNSNGIARDQNDAFRNLNDENYRHCYPHEIPADSKKQKPVVQPEQEQIAKVGEYVINKENGYPNKACKVYEVNGTYYRYTYPNGSNNGCNAEWIRKATQQEIDRDWEKKELVDEKVYPLMQVLLTQKQIDKLKEILK
jgi:hypothetical protein